MILNPQECFHVRGRAGATKPPPNFLFLVLRPGEVGTQHQKIKAIKRRWYDSLHTSIIVLSGAAMPLG